MSPLARSLLALACAALLHAACAEIDPPRCSIDTEGRPYGKTITLPEIKIPTRDGPVVIFEIPDKCKLLPGMVLQGESAEACDWNAEPTVVMYHLRKVQVTRNNFTYDEPDATLQIYQYC